MLSDAGRIPSDRRLRGDRRPACGRARRSRRLDRLALQPVDRLAERLRGVARPWARRSVRVWRPRCRSRASGATCPTPTCSRRPSRPTVGTVRVTDSLNLDNGTELPWRELARRVECTAGSVPLRWEVAPRFDYGSASGSVEPLRRSRVPDRRRRADARRRRAGAPGAAVLGDGTVSGSCVLREGERALLALLDVGDGPRVLVHASERRGADRRHGRRLAPLRGRRSSTTGRGGTTSCAALSRSSCSPTPRPAGSSPPRRRRCRSRIGGDRNFDYRFCWLRDMSFTLDALLNLGLLEQAHASYLWLLGATARSHPRMQPFYTLDGSAHPGGADARPAGLVRQHAGARRQRGRRPAAARELRRLLRRDDALRRSRPRARPGDRGAHGRRREPRLCGLAARRRGHLGAARAPSVHDLEDELLGRARPRDRARGARSGRPHGTPTAGAESATRSTATSRASAGRSAAAPTRSMPATRRARRERGRRDPARLPRGRGTARLDAAAVRAELGAGPHLYRYSGQAAQENCFVACGFWEAEALARLGRVGRRSRADGRARSARQRRRALVGADRPGLRRPAREHAPGAQPPRVDQRRLRDPRRLDRRDTVQV